MQSPLPGQVFCWGSGSTELGNVPDREGVIPFPTRVPNLPGDIIQVECGDQFTVALSQSGVVYTFGSSTKGKLGRIPDRNTVGVVEGLRDIFVKFIAVGQGHSLCIGTNSFGDTAVYGWGNAFRSALPPFSSDVLSAVRIGGLPDDLTPISRVPELCGGFCRW